MEFVHTAQETTGKRGETKSIKNITFASQVIYLRIYLMEMQWTGTLTNIISKL